jgi:hypothetical protein
MPSGEPIASRTCPRLSFRRRCGGHVQRVGDESACKEGSGQRDERHGKQPGGDEQLGRGNGREREQAETGDSVGAVADEQLLGGLEILAALE